MDDKFFADLRSIELGTRCFTFVSAVSISSRSQANVGASDEMYRSHWLFKETGNTRARSAQ
jgi:hypothetical protein